MHMQKNHPVPGEPLSSKLIDTKHKQQNWNIRYGVILLLLTWIFNVHN